MAALKHGVLVVEDSDTVLNLMVDAIAQHPELEVVGVARNGVHAVQRAQQLAPAVITMDLLLPGLDGTGAIRQIMASRPTPIVVITSAGDRAGLDAIQAGALDVVRKPSGMTLPAGRAEVARMVGTIRLMAEVRVAGRRVGVTVPPPRVSMRGSTAPRIVTIAASTGGPPALRQVLHGLDASFPAPILVVQHITPGFGGVLTEWLASVCRIPVVTADSGVVPRAGTVYVAPDDRHLLVDRAGRLLVSAAQPVRGSRPSATLLFESAAVAAGAATAGIILTGMGADGVDGLRVIKERGGTVIAQDEATSTVFGMPAAAIAAGVVNQVLALNDIGAFLQRMQVTGNIAVGK